MASALAWLHVQAAPFLEPAALRVAHVFQRKS
jgi:hypothetical protein